MLDYFYSLYNDTWFNERCIEVAIALDFMEQYKGISILEVGNVLSNYINVDHDIVDKYEKRSNVINEDVESFSSKKRYDLIISISTLEHVGYDEIPSDETKIFRALQNLMALLTKNGRLVVTMPIGYNKTLDRYIGTRRIEFDEQLYMKRISKDNTWKQATWNEVRNCKYDLYFGANGLIVGINMKL